MRNFFGPAFALWGAFFITVHDPSGRDIYINAEQVDYIGFPSPGEADSHALPIEPPKKKNKMVREEIREDAPHYTAGSRVMVYGIWVWTREKPAELHDAIDKVLGQGDYAEKK